MPNVISKPAIVDHTPWRRWQRDLRRIVTQLGFRPLGIAAIVILAGAMWLDSAAGKLAQQSKEQRQSAAEHNRMKALIARRTHIELGLRDAGVQYDATRPRGLQGATLDQAVGAWAGDVRRVLAAHNVGDPHVAPAMPPATPKPASPSKPPMAATSAGGTPLGTLNVAFSGVPQQLVDVTGDLTQGGHLYRIAHVDVDGDTTAASPTLHVTMRLEALWMLPQQTARGKSGN